MATHSDEAYNRISRKAFSALLLIQRVEANLKFWLKWVFPNGDITVETLQVSDKELAKRTLGTLIHKLKEKLELENVFKCLFEDFLGNRNMFIHNLRNTDLMRDDDESRCRLEAFLDELITQAEKLDQITFQGIWLWKDTSGITTELDGCFTGDPRYQELLRSGPEAISSVIRRKR